MPWDAILTVAGGLLVLLCGALFAAYRWQLKQAIDKEQSEQQLKTYEKALKIKEDVAADRTNDWNATIAKLRSRAKP